jgi:hypothetical protein
MDWISVFYEALSSALTPSVILIIRRNAALDFSRTRYSEMPLATAEAAIDKSD